MPRDNELGRPARKCHTATMLTPNGKEYAQKITVRYAGMQGGHARRYSVLS